MTKRFFVCISLLILLFNCGIGITVAESSDDNLTDVSDQPTVDDSVNDDSVNDDSVNDDSVNDDSVNDDSVNDDSVNDDSVNDDSANDDSVNDDSANDDSVNDDSANDDSVNDDSVDDSLDVTPADDLPVDDTPADDTPVNDVSNDTSVNDTPNEGNFTDEREPTYDIEYYDESPESPINIQYVDTSQVYINNEQNVYVNITNDMSVVNNINFDATKPSGKTTVVVEDLKDKSVLIDQQPKGDIYKSFNIWIDNGGVNNIENAAVNFHVENAWLKENNIDKSAIILNMYSDGKWTEVPVTITGQDAKYVYFMAKVSGYSSFAITGQSVVVDTTSEQNVTVNNTTAESVDIPNKAEIIRLLEYIIELLR